MPLRISEIEIESQEVPGEQYKWNCSLCGLPLEVDWKVMSLENMPIRHSLEYCLKKLFEVVKMKEFLNHE